VAANKPQKAVLLTRISDARNGETAGVDDQRADLLKYAERLGWGVGPEASHVIEENNTSAFKRRKVVLPDGRKALRTYRPGFRRALELLQSGRADGLLTLDLDRTARDPRDLEDLIDVVESRNPPIPVESVTGSLRLGNDAEISMARVMVAMGNKSSRDTARRVARARQRQAEDGRPRHGGRRPFGYEPGGIVVRETEAAEIRRAADAILAGVSLRQVTADLRRRGVPTVTGVPWSAEAWKEILLRPRNAGLVVYQGEILEGVEAKWDEILPRESWEAVTAVLTDPNRRTTPGNTPRWLGSLIYRCGHPACIKLDPPSTLRVGTSGKRPQPAYRCFTHAHLTRVAIPLDAYVSAVLCRRLSQADAIDLLDQPATAIDTGELATQANALRERIREAKDLWESGVLSAADLKGRNARLSEQLADVQARLRSAAGHSPVADLAGRADAADVWAGLDLGRRRAILQTLAIVWVLPLEKAPGRAPFDPSTARIEWKERL
jgi:DNA invertase Pin-like site-specific DNA recombinase